MCLILFANVNVDTAYIFFILNVYYVQVCVYIIYLFY